MGHQPPCLSCFTGQAWHAATLDNANRRRFLASAEALTPADGDVGGHHRPQHLALAPQPGAMTSRLNIRSEGRPRVSWSGAGGVVEKRQRGAVSEGVDFGESVNSTEHPPCQQRAQR